MNYRLLKLIWKPGDVLIQRLSFVGVPEQKQLCEIQGFFYQLTPALPQLLVV